MRREGVSWKGFGFSAAFVTSLAQDEQDDDVPVDEEREEGTRTGGHGDHHGADVADMDPETQALSNELKIGAQEGMKISFDRVVSRTASRLCQSWCARAHVHKPCDVRGGRGHSGAQLGLTFMHLCTPTRGGIVGRFAWRG